MKENKDIRLTVRLTPEQYESICARADTAMMTPSAFVRAAAMRHKITVVPGVHELVREMKGIGRNINQLAILAHEGKINFVRMDEHFDQLYEIYGQIGELLQMEQQ